MVHTTYNLQKTTHWKAFHDLYMIIAVVSSKITQLKVEIFHSSIHLKLSFQFRNYLWFFVYLFSSCASFQNVNDEDDMPQQSIATIMCCEDTEDCTNSSKSMETMGRHGHTLARSNLFECVCSACNKYYTINGGESTTFTDLGLKNFGFEVKSGHLSNNITRVPNAL